MSFFGDPGAIAAGLKKKKKGPAKKNDKKKDLRKNASSKPKNSVLAPAEKVQLGGVSKLAQSKRVGIGVSVQPKSSNDDGLERSSADDWLTGSTGASTVANPLKKNRPLVNIKPAKGPGVNLATGDQNWPLLNINPAKGPGVSLATDDQNRPLLNINPVKGPGVSLATDDQNRPLLNIKPAKGPGVSLATGDQVHGKSSFLDSSQSGDRESEVEKNYQRQNYQRQPKPELPEAAEVRIPAVPPPELPKAAEATALPTGEVIGAAIQVSPAEPSSSPGADEPTLETNSWMPFGWGDTGDENQIVDPDPVVEKTKTIETDTAAHRPNRNQTLELDLRKEIPATAETEGMWYTRYEDEAVQGLECISRTGEELPISISDYTPLPTRYDGEVSANPVSLRYDDDEISVDPIALPIYETTPASIGPTATTDVLENLQREYAKPSFQNEINMYPSGDAVESIENWALDNFDPENRLSDVCAEATTDVLENQQTKYAKPSFQNEINLYPSGDVVESIESWALDNFEPEHRLSDVGAEVFCGDFDLPQPENLFELSSSAHCFGLLPPSPLFDDSQFGDQLVTDGRNPLANDDSNVIDENALNGESRQDSDLHLHQANFANVEELLQKPFVNLGFGEPGPERSDFDILALDLGNFDLNVFDGAGDVPGLPNEAPESGGMAVDVVGDLTDIPNATIESGVSPTILSKTNSEDAGNLFGLPETGPFIELDKIEREDAGDTQDAVANKHGGDNSIEPPPQKIDEDDLHFDFFGGLVDEVQVVSGGSATGRPKDKPRKGATRRSSSPGVLRDGLGQRAPSETSHVSVNYSETYSCIELIGFCVVNLWPDEAHSLREKPEYSSPVVSSVIGGDMVEVIDIREVEGENWACIFFENSPLWMCIGDLGLDPVLRRLGSDKAIFDHGDAAAFHLKDVGVGSLLFSPVDNDTNLECALCESVADECVAIGVEAAAGQLALNRQALSRETFLRLREKYEGRSKIRARKKARELWEEKAANIKARVEKVITMIARPDFERE